MRRAGFAGNRQVRAARGLAALLSIALAVATLWPSSQPAAAEDLRALQASPAAVERTQVVHAAWAPALFTCG